jgi:hypothetical protein
VQGLPQDLPIRERGAVRLVVRDTLDRFLAGQTIREPLEVWP